MKLTASRRNVSRFLTALMLRPTDLQYLPAWLHSQRQQHRITPLPWLPYAATRALERYVHPQAQVFEFGGGGSTLWLSPRVAALTTVEHDRGWYQYLKGELRNKNIRNCDLILCEADPPSAAACPDDPYRSPKTGDRFESYVTTIDRFADESLDVVLVDGRSRGACLRHAATKVRPGGVVVLDDSERGMYQAAMQLFHGWARQDVWGIRPHGLRPSRTTWWTRPSTAS